MVRFRRLYSKVDILIFSFSVKMSVRKKGVKLQFEFKFELKTEKFKKSWIAIEFGKPRKLGFGNHLVSEMAIVSWVNYIQN